MREGAAGGPFKVDPTNAILSRVTAVAVICLAVAAFTLSFSALRDLAIASGIPESLAFIWPLIVDGFIVVATASAFALKRRGRGVTWYPWTALVMFSAVSVAGNALHALDTDQVRVLVAVAPIVSAVPAIALLVASHLLVVMVSGSAPDRSSVEISSSTPVGIVPSVDHDPGLRPALTAPAEAVMAEPEWTRERLAQAVAEAAQRGESLSASTAATLIGKSPTTAKRWLADIRESEEERANMPRIGVKR